MKQTANALHTLLLQGEWNKYNFLNCLDIIIHFDSFILCIMVLFGVSLNEFSDHTSAVTYAIEFSRHCFCSQCGPTNAPSEDNFAQQNNKEMPR